MNDRLLLRWVGGAGFVLKTEAVTIGIDLYLSNACMRPDGSYKRLTPPPIYPKEIALDYLIASHEHGDHFDVDSINDLVRNDNSTLLICPTNTAMEAKRCGIEPSRVRILDRSQNLEFPEFSIRAFIADHGADAPDAIGFILTVAGKTVHFMGDTRFRTDYKETTGVNGGADVLLVPINGKFGNPGAAEAAYYVQMLKPKKAIPCHYWLFAEHGGNPGEFVDRCAEAKVEAEITLPAIGEEISI